MMNRFEFESKLGKVEFSASEEGKLSHILVHYSEEGSHADSHSVVSGNIPLQLISLLEQFSKYFTEGRPFQNIPWELIDRSNWTEFQQEVYLAISQIPHGETRTYGWVAERIGSPLAARAVGQALKKNPVPILIPCHRVIPMGGGIGGFMGKNKSTDPETQLKQKLISLEEGFTNPQFPFMAIFHQSEFCLAQ